MRPIMGYGMRLRARRRLWWLVLAAVIVSGAALVVAASTVDAVNWRTRVVILKTRGLLPDLSWRELAGWLPPGSPVWLGGLAETANPYTSIVGPETSEAARLAGAELYARHCASCHGADARGGTAPPLASARFRHGESDWALFRTIQRGVSGTAMPPHRIPETEIWALVGHVRALAVEPGGPSDARGERVRSPIHVPYERLLHSNEEPHNWLTYSGNYAGWRHSPLKQITPDNVARLTLAWTIPLSNESEKVETSPIVVDGVMYFTEPPGNVIAIDATTGSELWKYARAIPANVHVSDGQVNRGVAVLGDKVYVGTLDAHLVALSSATGAVEWDVEVARFSDGYSMTGVPLALKDRIVVGIAGGEYGTRGFIDAYDAHTGRRLWRFNTVPEPGDPGHDTWSGESWRTGGAPTWLTGSFDPASNVVYWGVGNPGPDFNGAGREGDNLYSNCVVALDADSGRLVWYFQFTPFDEHDWDAVQIPILADLDVRGVHRKLLLWANKNGFYYILDRETGAYIGSRAFVRQTWADGIDERGRPRVRPESRPSPRGTLVYPGASGGTNWWSPSLSTTSGLVYIPALEQGSVFVSAPPQVSPTRMFLGGVSIPQTEYYHALRALDPTSGELRWEYRFEQDGAGISGVLSTAANVVFAGYATRFYGFDALSGTRRWEVRLGDRIRAQPISFMLDGRQMITIATRRALFTFALPVDEALPRLSSGR
jgi:alcohol dehydrogenase (cytochrome c)